MNTAAGFLLASKGDIKFGLMAATLVSTALIIASACVLNNYLDRGIDSKMDRTRGRPSVTGSISLRRGLIFAFLLAGIGFVCLAVFTNFLTFLIGTMAYILYVAAYGIAKRRSVHGTLVGSIPGALPPVAGYTAVTGNLDTASIAIFFILVTWQMAHFYSIAIYRLKDYKAAGLPVYPAVYGALATKRQIIAYIIAFIVSVTSLSVFGYTGVLYSIAMLVVSLLWLKIAYAGLYMTSNTRWARQTFKFSLVVILVLSLMMSVGPVLP